MVSRRVNDGKAPRTRRPPATTPDARENQLIAAAIDLAEQQLHDGTASAQVLTHYLKLGSSRERLEQQRMEMEVELMEARKRQIASQAQIESLITDALVAMRSYTGTQIMDDDRFEIGEDFGD